MSKLGRRERHGHLVKMFINGKKLVHLKQPKNEQKIGNNSLQDFEKTSSKGQGPERQEIR